MRFATGITLLVSAVLAAGVQPCCLFGKGHCAAAQPKAETREAPRCPHCTKHGTPPDERPAPSKPCDCGDKSVSLAQADRPAHLDGPSLSAAPPPAPVAAPAPATHDVAPVAVGAAPPGDAARNLPLLL